MRYPRLHARLYGKPLLVTEERFAVIEQVFRTFNESEERPHALPKVDEELPRHELAAGPMKRTSAGYLLTESGIAVVPVLGTLVQRGDAIDAASGFMGYNRIQARVQAAVADEDVSGILLEIDSPGGESGGCFELVKTIAELGQQKPIWAYANEQAFSAAYAIACAAERLYLPETGEVGSVGVLMMHRDQSKLDERLGLAYTPIFAGKKKADWSPHAPLSKRVIADGQNVVDHLYDIFVARVAEGRRIDADAVRRTEAGVLLAPEALAIGFVDGIASFSETLALLEQEVAGSNDSTSGSRAASGSAMAVHINSEAAMPRQDETQSAAPATNTAPAIDQQLAQARADGLAEGERNARKAAHDRITAILDCEAAKDRPKLARHLAISTDMSAEAAQATLAAAAIEVTAAAAPPNPLAAAMAGVPNPKVGADASPPEGDAAEAEAAATRIVAFLPRQQRK